MYDFLTSSNWAGAWRGTATERYTRFFSELLPSNTRTISGKKDHQMQLITYEILITNNNRQMQLIT